MDCGAKPFSGIRHEKFGRADVQEWGLFSACSPLSSLPPHPAPPQTQIIDDAESDLGACSSGVISGSAPWIFLHGLLTTLVGASTALRTLLPFPLLDLATKKSEKLQKGGKNVNKLGLFMIYLVVSSEVIATSGAAMLAQSASSDGADDEEGEEGSRKLTTYAVSGQDAFFNKISSGTDCSSCPQGNALMSDGDELVAAEGVYQCGTCYHTPPYGLYICGACYADHVMNFITDLYGVIRCQNDDLECKLDGEGSRAIMQVWGTGGGTLC